MTDYGLQGKVAIVTGSADGIGKAVARNLAEQGCRLALVDIKDDEGQQAAKELNACGEAAYFHCDLTSMDELTQTFDAILARFGGVDILVNNAGIPVRGSIEEIEPDWWDKFNSINMKAVFFLSKLAAQNMRAKGWGRIVNISSIRSVLVDNHHPGYNITKAGVNAITQNFAIRFARWGITANALLLGFVRSPMTEHYMSDPAAVDYIKRLNPQGRFIEKQDVADAVLFLVSDKAKAVNAQLITLDGGGTVTRDLAES